MCCAAGPSVCCNHVTTINSRWRLAGLVVQQLVCVLMRKCYLAWRQVIAMPCGHRATLQMPKRGEASAGRKALAARVGKTR